MWPLLVQETYCNQALRAPPDSQENELGEKKRNEGPEGERDLNNGAM